MILAVSVPTEIEHFLRSQATQLGVPIETLLSRTIEERWSASANAVSLSLLETELIHKLNLLTPIAHTSEYKDLCAQSDSGTISSSNRHRLLELIESRDQQNAERLEVLGELARLRGISLRSLMFEFEIRPD